MTDEARESKNAYQRAWTKKNREKVKAIQARYWAKKAAEARGENLSPVELVLPPEFVGMMKEADKKDQE